MVQEVDEQALDVRAVMVLIGHDHDFAIAKISDIFVFLSWRDSNNLAEVLNLWIVAHLLDGCLSNIQKLTPERKHAVFVAADDLDSGECQCFGGVSLGQDDGTVLTFFSTGVVGIFEFWDAEQLVLLPASSEVLSHLGLLFRSRDLHDEINDTRVENLLHEGIRQLNLTSEVVSLCVERLLRLRVEGRILNLSINEHPQVVLDVLWLDHGLLLVLFVDDLNDLFRYLVGDVLDMSATARRADTVDETDLLECTF